MSFYLKREQNYVKEVAEHMGTQSKEFWNVTASGVHAPSFSHASGRSSLKMWKEASGPSLGWWWALASLGQPEVTRDRRVSY